MSVLRNCIYTDEYNDFSFRVLEIVPQNNEVIIKDDRYALVCKKKEWLFSLLTFIEEIVIKKYHL